MSWRTEKHGHKEHFFRFLFLLISLLPLSPVEILGASKPIMVYYMPWYVAKPHSPDWGWHWTMDHFKPDVINASGERQIASWYYPLIGPYDSSDPAVLEYHVLLMKLAGIDGAIVDWYGFTPYLDYGINNEATARLFNFTRKAGLKFAICYEDQTVKHMVEGNYLPANNAVAHAQEVMLYLQTNYFGDPSYFRLKGKPVLLNFGPQYFMASSNWDAVFSVLAATNQPAFFTEDNRLAASAGAFSWPPMWMSQAPGTAGVLSSAALKKYLTDFDQKAAGWPAFISSAFPRFHDVYQKAGVRDFWGYLGDANGDTFRETLSRAITNNSTMVQIITWNDFGEGTVVEPTQEYGFRDLGLIQDFRRQYFDKSFSYHTNDLALALRFYQARKQHPEGSRESAALDRIFSNIISGKLEAANSELEKMTKESKLSAAKEKN
jgi:hypothetical protein